MAEHGFATCGGETIPCIFFCLLMLHRMKPSKGSRTGVDVSSGHRVARGLSRPPRRCGSHRLPNMHCSQYPFQWIVYITPPPESDIDQKQPSFSRMSSKLLFTQSSPLDTTIANEATGNPLYEIETENNKVQKITVVRKLDLSASSSHFFFSFHPKT